ncbi:MAG: DUF721 domain-containing protein [Paludibacter sp.]|jgi:predicted nucleic acid-binding Zn ribbon protein|nr:DUF721 domain-containing protein [Paludibacter sp.]
MRRQNTEALSEVIAKILKTSAIQKPFYEKRVLNAWSEVLGDNIKQYTLDLSVKNKVLYATLSSSVLRQELFLQREKICSNINKVVGAEVIKEIRLR